MRRSCRKVPVAEVRRAERDGNGSGGNVAAAGGPNAVGVGGICSGGSGLRSGMHAIDMRLAGIKERLKRVAAKEWIPGGVIAAIVTACMLALALLRLFGDWSVSDGAAAEPGQGPSRPVEAHCGRPCCPAVGARDPAQETAGRPPCRMPDRAEREPRTRLSLKSPRTRSAGGAGTRLSLKSPRTRSAGGRSRWRSASGRTAMPLAPGMAERGADGPVAVVRSPAPPSRLRRSILSPSNSLSAGAGGKATLS